MLYRRLHTSILTLAMILVVGLGTRMIAGDLSNDGAREPRPLTGVNTPAREQNPTISADGRILFFASDRNNDGGPDIFEARRDGPNSDFVLPPLQTGSGLKSTFADFPSQVTDGGLTLYFFSNRRTGSSNYDIFVATRDRLDDDFVDVRPLDEINTPRYHEGRVALTGDGKQLFFVSNRPPSVGRDIWLAERSRPSEPFVVVRNVSEINTFGKDREPTVSADGRLLLWDRDGSSIWCASRENPADPEEPFGEARLLPAIVNSNHRNSTPSLAGTWPAESAMLVFTREIGGNRDLFEATWIPTEPLPATFLRGDCNDDGAVNITDVISFFDALFRGQGVLTCEDACDSNNDGKVDISDGVTTLGVLFRGQGSIPAPGMEQCGADPQDPSDELGCEGYASCP